MSCRGRGTAHASEHRAGLRPTPRPGSPWLSACAQPDQSPPTRASRARSLWIAAYPALTMWTTKTAGRRRRIVVVRAATIRHDDLVPVGAQGPGRRIVVVRAATIRHDDLVPVGAQGPGRRIV